MCDIWVSLMETKNSITNVALFSHRDWNEEWL